MTDLAFTSCKSLYVCVRAGAESDESHLVAADHDHQWFQCELLAESTHSSLASVHEMHMKKLASEWSGVAWRATLFSFNAMGVDV